MSTVLLIGEDHILMETRAAVLRITGAFTVCSNAASALALHVARSYDLVVLCHSVPEPLCLSLAAAIRNRWPATPILLVTSTSSWEHVDAGEAIDTISSADPERLIVRAIELLPQQQSGHVSPPRMLH